MVTIVSKGHGAIWVHGSGSVKLHIIVSGKDPLAESRCSLGESLDFGSGNAFIVLQLLAELLAVILKVVFEVLLSNGYLLQVETNGLVDHIVDDFGIVINLIAAASELVTASNVDGGTRILVVIQNGTGMKIQMK